MQVLLFGSTLVVRQTGSRDYPSAKKNFAPRLGIAWVPHGGPFFLGSLLGKDRLLFARASGLYMTISNNHMIRPFRSERSVRASLVDHESARNPDPRHIASTYGFEYHSRIGVGSSASRRFPANTADIPGNIYWGVDNSLKTPYSYQIDFSVGVTGNYRRVCSSRLPM